MSLWEKGFFLPLELYVKTPLKSVFIHYFHISLNKEVIYNFFFYLFIQRKSLTSHKEMTLEVHKSMWQMIQSAFSDLSSCWLSWSMPSTGPSGPASDGESSRFALLKPLKPGWGNHWHKWNKRDWIFNLHDLLAPLTAPHCASSPCVRRQCCCRNCSFHGDFVSTKWYWSSWLQFLCTSQAST